MMLYTPKRTSLSNMLDHFRNVQGRGIGRLCCYVIKSVQRPLNHHHCNSLVKYYHFHPAVNSIVDQSLSKHGFSHALDGRTATNWLISSEHKLLHSKIFFRGSVKLYTTESSSQRAKKKAARSDLVTQDEDPFDSLTDKIPQKPVTFVEGASYSFIILIGFAVAGFAAYGVFKELIFEPKEYKVFNKALHRVQNDNQVTVRIGSPITGYGQDTRNRAARQHIPHRAWSDEDGIQRVEVQFYVRGPHGYGQVHSEMFKDREDKQWKFTYLIVDIVAPSPTRLMLESYVPA